MDKRVYLGSFKGMKAMKELQDEANRHRAAQSGFVGLIYNSAPLALGGAIIAFFSVAGIATIVVHLLK